MLKYTHSIFSNSAGLEVPNQLILRDSNINNVLIYILILSFFLITIAKYRNGKIFVILTKLLLSSKNVEHVLKEELRLGSLSSVTLMLNYFIALATSITLVFYFTFHYTVISALMSGIAFSGFFIILQLLGLFLMGLVSNEFKLVFNVITETLLLFESFGIFFFVLTFLWLLNPEYSQIFDKVFLLFIGINFLIRFTKSSLISLQRGISWYYIILYLCTLEILPMLGIYYYIGSLVK